MNAQSDPTVRLLRELDDTAFRQDYAEGAAKLEFGLAIAVARKSLGMTQREAAHRCGVSQAYLSKLESGDANPTIGQVGSILGAWWLGLNVSHAPLVASDRPKASATERRLAERPG